MKKFRNTKKTLVIIFLFTIVNVYKSFSQEINIAQNKSKIEIKTFENKSKGWGYDIYLDNVLYLHQPHIPAIKGDAAFKTQNDAEKAAKFVSQKIKNNIMPPTITIDELDSLGVLGKTINANITP